MHEADAVGYINDVQRCPWVEQVAPDVVECRLKKKTINFYLPHFIGWCLSIKILENISRMSQYTAHMHTHTENFQFLGFFVYGYAKLRMLEFYDFLWNYYDTKDFELLEMDTGSHKRI